MDRSMLKREYFLLLLILITSFVLRLSNVWFAYPLTVHPDEPILVEIALRMVNTGDLNPHNFLYPSFNIYLQALLFKLVSVPATFLGVQWPAREVDYYVCARILNVIFSTATIYIVYEIGRRLFSRLTGLVAAYFISVSTLHINHSYFATVDTPTAFWSSMACFMAVMIYTSGTKRWFYVVGGISVGLAIGSKYTAFSAILPIIVAHTYHARQYGSWLDKNIVISMLCVPIAFFVTTPYALLDIKAFLIFLAYQSQAYSSHAGAESSTSTSVIPYFKYLLSDGYGKLSILLALTGMLHMFTKNRYKACLIVSFPLAIVVFLGFYKVYFNRNILPIIPFIALLSGYSVDICYQQLSSIISRFTYNNIPKLAASSLILLLIYMSTQSQLKNDLQLVRENNMPDTRLVSLNWCLENIPPGVTVGRQYYTPPIERFSDKHKVVLMGISGFVTKFDEMKICNYLILSDGVYNRYLENPDRYPAESTFYKDFFANSHLVKEFVGDGKSMSGPTIRVYKKRG